MGGYKSLLLFLVGLIATSVALVAAAFSTMKDVWDITDWKLTLLAFIAWMAVTIIVATGCALYLQCRFLKRQALNPLKLEIRDYAAAIIPALVGVVAALHLIDFALANGAPIIPFR